MGVARGAKSKDLPLSTAPENRDLFARVVDKEQMLAVFRRALPPLAEGEIRVTGCKVKPSKSRKSIRQGRLDVVYRVRLEVQGEERELLVLGVVPATPELLDRDAEERSRALRSHPWAAPFRELKAHVAELELALLFFPMDPALPGLAEVTGGAGARILAGALPECRAGAELVSLKCELVRYKPLDRAVVKLKARLRDGAGEGKRVAYAKFFADERGEEGDDGE